MYLHTLPTTGALSFSDFLITTSTVSDSEIAQATEARARLRTVLKENKHDHHLALTADRAGNSRSSANKDWLRVVKTVDEYLPYLLSIFNCLQTDDLILRKEPEFSWVTTLSSSSLFRSPPRVTCAGIYYELVSALSLYGASLSNLAFSVTQSLGPYESNPHLSTADKRTKDERLKYAADTLCSAAGVLEYVSEKLIPQWENTAGRIDGRPPDVTREVTMALSKLALADAQTLAIRKLLAPSLSESVETMTPGPPLPKSHPSPSLLAKLNLNVASLYESASALSKTVERKPFAHNESYVPDYRSDSGSHEDGTDVRPGTGASNSASSMSLSQSAAAGGVRPGGDGNRNRRKSSDDNGHDTGNNGGGTGNGMLGKLKKGLAPPSTTSASRTSSSTRFRTADPSSHSTLEVSASLLRYLSNSSTLAHALAYKWLALDAGEARGRYGEGIAFLQMAKNYLEKGGESSRKRDAVGATAGALGLGSGGGHASVSGSGSSGSGSRNIKTFLSRNGKEALDTMKCRCEAELKCVDHWLKAYHKLNNTVAFQPIPRASDLQSRIPAGRVALLSKPFKPPQPAFGPGSSGFLSEGMKRLGIDKGGCEQGTAHNLGLNGILSTKSREEGAKYAGSGAYY